MASPPKTPPIAPGAGLAPASAASCGDRTAVPTVYLTK
jgi:hypothetical protein